MYVRECWMEKLEDDVSEYWLRGCLGESLEEE